jgi:hypothetical protein
VWTGFKWLRIRSIVSNEHGNKPYGSTRQRTYWPATQRSDSEKELCPKWSYSCSLLPYYSVSMPILMNFISRVRGRQGRAIAQAVSRWLPTAAARVWSSGICGGQSGAGAVFLRVPRFPLPIFIPPIAPQSPSSIIWGCTIGQKWPQYLVT